MRILLVVPVRKGYHIPSIDLGLGYLASAVRKAGFDVEILHCGREGYNFADFAEYIKRKKFDCIGFKCFSRDFNSVVQHSRIIKQYNPRILTVVGGPQASALPEYTFSKMPNIDFGFKGEAEVGFVKFLKSFKKYGFKVPTQTLNRIPGLIWRKKNGQIKINPQYFVRNLDKIAFPAWDLIEPHKFPDSVVGQYVPIITTRGCPYACTYCSAHQIVGRNLRYRSVENVLKEIELLYRKYKINKISIADDNFTFSKDFVINICSELIKRKIKISWDCSNGVRLDTLDKDLVKTMEKAGCYSLAVGIESGSQRILNSVNKHLKIQTIKEKVSLIKKNTHIKITGFCMIGFPDETEGEINQTINLAKSLELDYANFSITMSLPGTKLFDDLLNQKKIDLETLDWDDMIADKITFPRENLTDRELLGLQKKAYLQFYLRFRIIKNIILEIWRAKDLYKILTRKAISVIFRR